MKKTEKYCALIETMIKEPWLSQIVKEVSFFCVIFEILSHDIQHMASISSTKRIFLTLNEKLAILKEWDSFHRSQKRKKKLCNNTAIHFRKERLH